MVTYSLIVQMQFSAGVWTDVSSDVERPINWSRGIEGNGPADNVASPGTCEFEMDNSERNSAATLGLYSPNHPSCRSGLREGIPVRLLVTSGSYTDQPVWTGKITSILPSVGLYGVRRTHIIAKDCMEDLANEDVREVSRQLEQTEVAVLSAVLDSLPSASQPAARSFDPAEHEFPVALDDLGSGERALGVCERIVTSARGSLYPLANGALKYQSFSRRVLEISQFEFTDVMLAGLNIPSSLDNVYGRVRVTTHPKTFAPSTSPAIMVLASHEGRMALAPGESVELFLTYQDPDRPEVKIGGTDFEDDGTSPAGTLEATDYEFNSDEDGGGADVTSEVSVHADFFASTVKLTITNHDSAIAYKQRLQVRGRGIYDQNPVTREAFTEMSGRTRIAELDFPYQDDEAFAQQVADLLQASYRNRADQVESLEFYPADDEDLMAQALTGEIGTVIDASESVALPDGVSAYIQSIAGDIDTNDQWVLRYGLAPRIVRDALLADDLLVSSRLVLLAEAPEQRVDRARVDFSEVA